jgi:hypothetical protein
MRIQTQDAIQNRIDLISGKLERVGQDAKDESSTQTIMHLSYIRAELDLLKIEANCFWLGEIKSVLQGLVNVTEGV